MSICVYVGAGHLTLAALASLCLDAAFTAVVLLPPLIYELRHRVLYPPLVIHLAVFLVHMGLSGALLALNFQVKQQIRALFERAGGAEQRAHEDV